MNTITPVELAVSNVRRAAFEISATDEKQASRMLREALKLTPGHADLLGDLAVLHLQAGRHEQCIQAAREALLADPSHDESAYALALALDAGGQWAEARKTFEELVLGHRAQRFEQQQPELTELCRLKLAQRRGDPPAGSAAGEGPLAASSPDRPVQAGHGPDLDRARTSPGEAGPCYAPPLIRPQALGHLLDETSGIRQLTLDCFDTILWRHTDRPDDVFYEMQQRPAFRAAGIDAAMRAGAERYARELHRVRTGRTEVSLDQIYLAARPGASREMLRWLAEDELAAEMLACHAHPGAIRLLRDARARGLPVTIVSDTYFSAEQLRRLLGHALPDDALAAIGDIVCSSEHGAGKAQGLFKLARLSAATDASTVLHVGDNKDADVKAPRALGMSATHLMHETDAGMQRRSMGAIALSMLDPGVRSGRPMHMPYRAVHATCGSDAPAPHTEIGHAALGPVMHAFARWIDEEAAALSATRDKVKLVFLMRDAHLPLETYRAVGGTAEAHAARISRFSACAASFRRLEHVDHYLAQFAHGLTLEMVARQLLLSPERAEPLIAEAESAPNPLQHFIAAVRQPEVLAEIVAASAAYRQRLRRYLERQTGMTPGDTLVLVDLGYAGTIQRVLGPILTEDWGVQVFGRYLLAVGAVDDGRRALIDRSWLDDRALATLKPYVGLLETLSADQGQSAVGYDDDGLPLFEAKQIDDGQSALVCEIQQECLRFAREASEYFRAAGSAPATSILRDEALASFARMLFFPSAQELRHLSRFELEINLGSGVTRRLFDLDAGLEGLRRHGLFYVNRAQSVSDLRMAIPAELRAAGLELSLSMLAQHRFGLPFFSSAWSMRSSPVQAIFARGSSSSQIMVDAMPTHDGYFSALVPISEKASDIGLAFGRDHEWIQIHSIEVVALSGGQGMQGIDVDAMPLFVRSGVQDHGHGLLRFTQADALLMLPAGAVPAQGRAALRVVFRPIAARTPQAGPHDPA